MSIKPFGGEARSLVKHGFELLTRVPESMAGGLRIRWSKALWSPCLVI